MVLAAGAALLGAAFAGAAGVGFAGAAGVAFAGAAGGCADVCAISAPLRSKLDAARAATEKRFKSMVGVEVLANMIIGFLVTFGVIRAAIVAFR